MEINEVGGLTFMLTPNQTRVMSGKLKERQLAPNTTKYSFMYTGIEESWLEPKQTGGRGPPIL
jgi:hypothetical protein